MSGDNAKAGGPCAASVASAQEPSALGLVSSSTTDRKDQIRIDRFESRYRRLRKNVITSARLLREGMAVDGFRHFLAMVTLTYAPDVEWDKSHIPDLQKKIRALNRPGFPGGSLM